MSYTDPIFLIYSIFNLAYKKDINNMNELQIGDLLILPNHPPLLVISKIPVRRFEFKDSKSNKFWEVFEHNQSFTTRWGRIGSEGKTKTYDIFANSISIKNKIDEKLKEGYKEIKLVNSLYLFKDVMSSKSRFLCSSDLESYLLKNSASIQRKK